MEQSLREPVILMAYPFGKPGRHFRNEPTQIAVGTSYEYAAMVLFRAVTPHDSVCVNDFETSGHGI
jgi:hypothetical protein